MGARKYAHHQVTRSLTPARGITGAAVELGSSVTMLEKLDGGGGATSKGIVRIAKALANHC